VRDQGGADQTETEARSDEGNQHGGRKASKDKQRSIPRHASHTCRHAGGVRTGEYLLFKDIVGNVDFGAHEK
jgi:hypothetical protein